MSLRFQGRERTRVDSGGGNDERREHGEGEFRGLTIELSGRTPTALPRETRPTMFHGPLERVVRFHPFFASGNFTRLHRNVNRALVPGTGYSNEGLLDRSASIDISFSGRISPFSNS